MIRSLLVSAMLMTTTPVMASELAHPPLSPGEHLTLRSYTGQAIGHALTHTLKAESVGFAVNASTICSSLTGAAAGRVVADHKSKPHSMLVSVVAKPEDAASAVQSLKNYKAVALMFGGQTPAEENAALVKAMLAELAKAEYAGPVFLHLAVWGGRMAEKAAAEDATIANYLAGKDNLYALTVDKDHGKALIHKVSIKDGKQDSVKLVQEVPMNEEWLTLFKRSLLKRG